MEKDLYLSVAPTLSKRSISSSSRRCGGEPDEKEEEEEEEGEEIIVGDGEADALERPPLAASKRRVVIFTCLVGLWIIRGINGSSVSTSLGPEIAARIEADNLLGWFGAAYLLPQACLLVGLVSLVEIFNHRIFGTVSMVGYTAGGLLCIFATNGPVFLLGRALSGLANAVSFCIALHFVGCICRPDERTFYVAMLVAADVASFAAGAVICGALGEIDYRWAFALVVAGYLATFGPAVALFQSAPGSPPPPSFRAWARRFDFVGFALMMMASLLVLLGIQLASDDPAGWLDKAVILSLAIAAVALGLLAVHQATHARPEWRLIPPVLAQKRIAISFALAFLVAIANYVVFFLASLFAQAGRGATPLAAACVLLGFYGPFGAACLGLPWLLPRRFPWPRAMMLVSLVIGLAGTVPLATSLTATTPLATLAALLVIPGLACGAGQALASWTAQEWTAVPSLRSTAFALVITLQYLGGSVGSVVADTAVRTGLGNALRRLGDGLSDDVIVRIVAVAMEKERLGSLPGLDDAVRRQIPRLVAESIRTTFYLAVGALAVAVVLAGLLAVRRTGGRVGREEVKVELA